MPYLLRNVVALLQQHDRKTMFNPEFFEIRPSKAAGQEFHVVKPVARFVDEPVDLCYNVGTRTNGVDQPMWPKDLTTEIVGGTAPYKCVPLSTGMSREKRL